MNPSQQHPTSTASASQERAESLADFTTTTRVLRLTILAGLIGGVSADGIRHLPVVSRSEPGRVVGFLDRGAVMAAWTHATREERAREEGWLAAPFRALRERLGGT